MSRPRTTKLLTVMKETRDLGQLLCSSLDAFTADLCSAVTNDSSSHGVDDRGLNPTTDWTSTATIVS